MELGFAAFADASAEVVADIDAGTIVGPTVGLGDFAAWAAATVSAINLSAVGFSVAGLSGPDLPASDLSISNLSDIESAPRASPAEGGFGMMLRFADTGSDLFDVAFAACGAFPATAPGRLSTGGRSKLGPVAPAPLTLGRGLAASSDAVACAAGLESGPVVLGRAGIGGGAGEALRVGADRGGGVGLVEAPVGAFGVFSGFEPSSASIGRGSEPVLEPGVNDGGLSREATSAARPVAGLSGGGLAERGGGVVAPDLGNAGGLALASALLAGSVVLGVSEEALSPIGDPDPSRCFLISVAIFPVAAVSGFALELVSVAAVALSFAPDSCPSAGLPATGPPGL